METHLRTEKNPAQTACLNRTMQYGNEICYVRRRADDNQFKSYYVVWKLFFHLFFHFSQIRLNRTMQYGNNILARLIYGRFLGLNRTMQYGNEKMGTNKPRKRRRFKSYYVVWKPVRHQRLYFFCGRFKSYYVVWKPVWLEKHTVRKQCLNRTMQYGNFSENENNAL